MEYVNIDEFYHLRQDTKIIDYPFILDRYYYMLDYFARNSEFLLSNLDVFTSFIFHFSDMHDRLFNDLDFSNMDVMELSSYHYQRLKGGINKLSSSDKIFITSCLCIQRISDFQLSDFMEPVICELFFNFYKIDQVLSKEYVKTM